MFLSVSKHGHLMTVDCHHRWPVMRRAYQFQEIHVNCVDMRQNTYLSSCFRLFVSGWVVLLFHHNYFHAINIKATAWPLVTPDWQKQCFIHKLSTSTFIWRLLTHYTTEPKWPEHCRPCSNLSLVTSKSKFHLYDNILESCFLTYCGEQLLCNRNKLVF